MTDVRAVGANPTRLWGLTSAERLARIAKAQGHAVAEDGPILANLDYVWDPAWLRFVAERPGTVVTRDGVPVLAHGADADVLEAMTTSSSLSGGGTVIAWESAEGIVNDELRKRERPFMDRLTPAAVRQLERASYFGAYKGVTDALTLYLWPEWALVLTRIAARLRITPNMVTALGFALCVAATFLFYHGWYWTGLAVGLGFMVLDTVDGKLARCTITSSWWGNVLDHGIDLVHPPFWWWAWGVGLTAYGRPLAPEWLWGTLAAILVGYVVQRMIEGAFIARFNMHIHVWERFDSRFRLITARRNPNMVILLAFLAIDRPDWGLIAVAAWTVASCAVHLVRLLQAIAATKPIRSWLA